MGLSIYYRLKIKTDAPGARLLVRRLHEFARTLPFDKVSPVVEYDPPDGTYAFECGDDDEESRRWKPGDAYLTRTRADRKTENVRVPALHVLCFHANTRGAETATFGLATHPPVVLHREDVITSPAGCSESRQIGAGPPIEFSTRLRGWYSWSGGTKTQYAANARHGGIENFLRAHVSVFRVIEEAKRLGLTTFARDDGRYWRHRSEQKLIAELAKWDELVAGFVGRVSDTLSDAPGTLVAPIKDRPDYEHLEAKGAARLKKLHRGKRPKRRSRGGDADGAQGTQGT